MIKFLDGPASGVVLSLYRAPFFMRVVKNGDTGKFDGLDQPKDYPTAQEHCFAYMIFKFIGSGIQHPTAEYKAVPFGNGYPGQAEMGCNKKWLQWCERNAPLFEKFKEREEGLGIFT